MKHKNDDKIITRLVLAEIVFKRLGEILIKLKLNYNCKELNED